MIDLLHSLTKIFMRVRHILSTRWTGTPVRRFQFSSSCWKQNVVSFQRSRDHLSHCLITTHPQISFRHSTPISRSTFYSFCCWNIVYIKFISHNGQWTIVWRIAKQRLAKHDLERYAVNELSVAGQRLLLPWYYRRMWHNVDMNRSNRTLEVVDIY
jgi:hypothetical protein